MHAGHNPRLICERCDFAEIEDVAALIRLHSPDLLFNALAVQRAESPELVGHYQVAPASVSAPRERAAWAVGADASDPRTPPDAGGRAERSYADGGQCGVPDVVNVVLSRAGLGPTVGIGNVANPVPALRKAVALIANAPLAPSVQ